MKVNLSSIIDNTTSLEQQVRQNGQIRKDRMYQFQNDFVLKMDQMNKELAKEVHGHYHTIDSGEAQAAGSASAVAGARAASRRSRVTLEDGDVRKIQKAHMMEVVMAAGMDEPDSESEGSVEAARKMDEDTMEPTLLESSKHEPISAASQSLSYANEFESHTIGTNEPAEQSDWLSVEGFKREKTEDELKMNQLSQIPDYLRAESFPASRIYTPSDKDRYIAPSSNQDARWRRVEDQMMKLKQAQRDYYNNKDFNLDSKELNHIQHKEIAEIEQNYMPIINKIQEQLNFTDNKFPTKPPSKTGQVIQINTANADQAKVRQVAIDRFVTGIHRQSEFFGLAKHANSALIKDKVQMDPRVTFYNQCWNANVVAIPTLAKIQNRVLSLKSYQLNAGSCKALGEAFSLYDHVLEKLYLESVGTNDEMFSLILRGLTEQECFKSITYKHNHIDLLSFEIIIKMIKRPMPYNLDQLRVVNCRIGPKAIQTFLPQINDSNLRRLSLVKAGINSTVVIHIL